MTSQPPPDSPSPEPWFWLAGLRPALAAVGAILAAQAFGLGYPQWAGLMALSTVAGAGNGPVGAATLLPKALGVLAGVALTLVGVGVCGQERWWLLAWLAALTFLCAAAGTWAGWKPFALAVGTTLVPATIFAVNDWAHLLTAAWSRAAESFLGFTAAAVLDAVFWPLFREDGSRTPVAVPGNAPGSDGPCALARAGRAGIGAAGSVALALALWYEAEIPGSIALVLNAGSVALAFAAAPAVSLAGALGGCALGGMLAAVLTLAVWPSLPQGPASFALPLLGVLWGVARLGRGGAFGGAVAALAGANLLIGLNLGGGVFSPQGDAVANRALGLFLGGLVSVFVLRTVATVRWPVGREPAASPKRGSTLLAEETATPLPAIPMVGRRRPA